MIRLIVSATMFGALCSGASWCVTNGPASISATAVQPNTPVETAAIGEAGPICTTMTELGTGSEWAQLDPDFAAGKRALAAKNWEGAITSLNLAVLRDPMSADIQNYIGYAHSRLGQLGPAMGHYQRALMLNPRHRGARTHLGELFLMLGETPKAQEQLAALQEICLVPCDEIAYLEYRIRFGTRQPSLPK